MCDKAVPPNQMRRGPRAGIGLRAAGLVESNRDHRACVYDIRR